MSATQAGNTTESYSYDPVCNRLSSLNVATYSYNVSNELTTNSNASYTFDANGNTVSKTNSAGTTSYTWNFENRLTGMTLPGTGGTVSFEYDPFGRRIEKISPNTTSIFAYDGDNLVETVNASGGEVASYAQADNIDEPLAMNRSGTIDYYEQDGLGSITSLTNSSGAIANSYTYDSFGNVTASTGTVSNPFAYTAREFDPEAGLYYYRARYYDPTVGRLISEDPLGFAGSGPSLFAYAFNNPTNFIDPYGLNAWDWLQNFSNFSNGAASALTFGLTDKINSALGNGQFVNRCSGWHTLGTVTGVGLSAAIGAEGLPSALSGLSSGAKGAIGEGLSLVENNLAGSTLMGTQVSAEGLGLSTVFDSVWQSSNGEIYYVESKFGTSGLTAAQGAAANVLGDAYKVERWGYGFFGRVGGYLGFGYGAAGATSGLSCGCSD
jgi:RHS repeat-associated protein